MIKGIHAQADRTTKLCHCGEYDNAGAESIPMYNSSWGKDELIAAIDGGGSVALSICQRVCKFGLSMVTY